MRIHQVRLRNYRGVGDCSVTFDIAGVTVIEGPNEVGKTCIPEALDLILRLPDSSKSRAVKQVQPVNRDEGPEMEVEMSTGPHRFVYSKRWLRRSQTTLTELEPSPRNLTGQEAHDRVRQILEETLDEDLWRALRVNQGAEVGLPCLDVPSLGRALDLVAGGEGSQDDDDDLRDRIAAERGRYWTNTGRPNADRKSAEGALAEARQTLERCTEALAEIEADVAEVARLEADEAQLRDTLAQSRAAESELTEQWQRIEGLQAQVAVLSTRRGAAEDRLKLTDVKRKSRREQVEAAEACITELRGLERDADRAAPALTAAINQKQRAEATLEVARAALRDAEAAKARVDADRDHHRSRIDLEVLSERHQRVVKAQEALSAAEDRLETLKIDDELLERIEAARLAVARAEPAAGAAATSMRITALADLEVQVADEEYELRLGSTREVTVEGEARVVVPGVVGVTVRAGGDSRSVTATRQEARAELRRLCEQGGVADLAAAKRAAETRRDAERDRTEARRTMKQDLRDLTLEELADKVARLGRRIKHFEAERAGDGALPADFDEAKRLATEAEDAVRGCVTERDRCEQALGQAAEVYGQAERKNSELSVRIDIARDDEAHAVERLAEARAERSDAGLDADLLEANQRFDAADADLRQASESLDQADPALAATLLQNARDAATRAGRDLEANRRKREQLRIGLEVRGEQGLAEGHDEALARWERMSADHQRNEARAEAARLLYETFESRRSQSLQRRRAPFKDRIEQLGRIVFGPGFAVELSDDLQVARRTLDGVTLDVSQLSIGAREQIGVLARLACAAIVSPDGGGAPVVLDDALGWSDPTRLVRMGAAIAAAGRECQVIVLTCTPGRYAHVGNATVVTLPN